MCSIDIVVFILHVCLIKIPIIGIDYMKNLINVC